MVLGSLNEILFWKNLNKEYNISVSLFQFFFFNFRTISNVFCPENVACLLVIACIVRFLMGLRQFS